MKIIIGIPTINRADLLAENLEDLARNFTDADKIYIVDNGNQQIPVPPPIQEKTVVYKEPSNLGVSGSWNKILDQAFFKDFADYVLMLNDDIVAGVTRELLEELIYESDQAYFLNSGSWGMFLISREAYQVFGKFDEEFYPAYFEDNDYSRRITRFNPIGSVVYRTKKLAPKVFRNSMSIKKDGNLNGRFGMNSAYYKRKWGGSPSNEKFQNAFNKAYAPSLIVITRTSRRPNFFKTAYESIHAQSIPELKHVVICDDIENSKYVYDYPNIELITVNRDTYKNNPRLGGGFYNVYLNHGVNKAHPEDYFIVLDDDDYYTDNTSIKEIWNNRGKHDLIVWKTRAAGGVVPFPQYFVDKRFVQANIAMPSFMVKRSIVGEAHFTKRSGGDYNFISQVQPNATNQLWVDKILASTTDGHRQGKGHRNDR